MQVEKKQTTKKGVVVSSKMDKTVVVRVDTKMRHPIYNKVITRSKKYYAHDPENKSQEGDKVTIALVRPLSKLKRWLVIQDKSE